MKIRVGTRGVGEGTVAATKRADVEHGVSVMWVELEGTRYDAVADAVVSMDEGFQHVRVTFVASAVEIVYTDAAGNELTT